MARPGPVNAPAVTVVADRHARGVRQSRLDPGRLRDNAMMGGILAETNGGDSEKFATTRHQPPRTAVPRGAAGGLTGG